MTTTTRTRIRPHLAAAMLARVKSRGGRLALDAALHTAWAASGWTAARIAQAAHDLARDGDVTLATDADGALIVVAKVVRQ